YPSLDLNEYVITPSDTDSSIPKQDTYTFTLDNPNEVPWLTVKGHELVGTEIIPTSSPSPATVTLTAKSNTSSMSTPETFKVTLHNGADPIWSNDTLLTPTAHYGNVYQSTVLHNYLQSGSGDYEFKIIHQTIPNLLSVDTDDGQHLVATN